MTLPAHTSILTALLPPTHGVHNNGSTALASGTPTLASLLHEAGYRTGAFVGAFVLDARFGLSGGFDVYDDRVGSETGPITFSFAERRADEVVRLAGDWILGESAQSPRSREQRDGSRSAASEGYAGAPRRDGIAEREPSAAAERQRAERQALGVGPHREGEESGPATGKKWLCWIHLFDPHAPYRAPEQRVAVPYDNEVAFTDANLGKLFDRLRAAGQLDSTLIVVVADHGESLGEHGEATHGLFAYEATLRVPLIIAGPSIHASVADAAIGQVDVLPTTLDLLGVKPPSQVDGRSMLPAMRGEPIHDQPIYFEALDAYLTRNWAPLTGVIANGWKYIDLPDAELFDLANDPGEQHNRFKDDTDRAVSLGRQLSAMVAALARAGAGRPD